MHIDITSTAPTMSATAPAPRTAQSGPIDPSGHADDHDKLLLAREHFADRLIHALYQLGKVRPDEYANAASHSIEENVDAVRAALQGKGMANENAIYGLLCQYVRLSQEMDHAYDVLSSTPDTAIHAEVGRLTSLAWKLAADLDTGILSLGL